MELNKVHMFCAPNSQLGQLQYLLLCWVTQPQTVFTDNFSCISSNVFAYKALAHSNQCIHPCISEVYTKEFPHSRVTHTITNSGTHTKKCTTRPALSPWLRHAICLSPPSPLTAAVCPGRLRASQKSPSVIQQHINLLKSQPFQKGRRQSKFSAVVQDNIIPLSQIQDSGTSALDDMKSDRGTSAFFPSPFVFLLLSTYLMSLGAFSKSHSPSLFIASYLYEHTGHTESGAAARSRPEERLEQYRLMAQETASASGMNK